MSYVTLLAAPPKRMTYQCSGGSPYARHALDVVVDHVELLHILDVLDLRADTPRRVVKVGAHLVCTCYVKTRWDPDASTHG